MIQFNLLPDVKQEYLRSQRLKQTIVSVSVIAAGAALFILVMLFLVVNVFQKQHLKDLNKDIKNDSAKLQSIPDLNKILTVQNQLTSLPAMNAKKPLSSNLFKYLSQIVPSKISISSIEADYTQSTIIFTGSADNLQTVNQFVDTLKFTTYQTEGSTTSKNAFSNVVLTTFSRTDKGATYTIKASFDPIIFDKTQQVSLTVPNIITTRSQLEVPSSLFNGQTQPTTSNQQGSQ